MPPLYGDEHWWSCEKVLPENTGRYAEGVVIEHTGNVNWLWLIWSQCNVFHYGQAGKWHSNKLEWCALSLSRQSSVGTFLLSSCRYLCAHTNTQKIKLSNLNCCHFQACSCGETLMFSRQHILRIRDFYLQWSLGDRWWSHMSVHVCLSVWLREREREMKETGEKTDFLISTEQADSKSIAKPASDTKTCQDWRAGQETNTQPWSHQIFCLIFCCLI